MSHPRPFYYLENFSTALAWLQQRYGDLLSEPERAFIEVFHRLPREPGALLVRMMGRQGDLFRTAKLDYSEIGCPRAAATALIEIGWIERDPRLTVADLGRLLRKSELHRVFRVSGPTLCARKSELLEQLAVVATEPRTLLEWWPEAPDVVYRLAVTALCERLRGLFFGNFRQEWSQFVLADLGIFKYEKVGAAAARAFQTREHIETFYALHACRQQLDLQRLEESGDIDLLLEEFPPPVADNEWLEARRRKVHFQIAQCFERRHELPRALEIYRNCQYSGARLRSIRLLERLGRIDEALELAAEVWRNALDEIETQQLARLWPRLQRKAGLIPAARPQSHQWERFDLVLPTSGRPVHLEQATGEALSCADAPVHYVENGLLNSLFGLLCWEAIFAPVPGAFFHEFQAAPADLHAPEFHSRREALFAGCFRQLESTDYQDTIARNFALKQGIQSPFVYWGLLTGSLLSLALACMPREHLRCCFQRILAGIAANRSGLPDLVQFWPQERRYRLIEVKGPGDRLQDNQIRWLTFCMSHGIPVAVCHVRWGGDSA